MKLAMRKVLVLGLAVACIAAACGGEAGETPVDPIPADLASVESAAESGFDAALAGDRTAVADAVNTAASHWSSYRGHGASDGVAADVLAAVDTAVANVNLLSAANATGPQLARAFDAISAPMARIYGVYKPPVPATLLDLDYLGRELIVDARVADLALATLDLDRLVARWAPFRSSVVAVGGDGQATAMDTTLANARRAIGARDVVALEVAGVAETDVVDMIEKLFADRARDGAD